MAVPAKERRIADGAARTTFPVVEIFGPTVQGEGPEAGRPAYFVRFGGCDYRCSWCDSMYAVDPAQVRAEARRLTNGEIVEGLSELAAGPGLVVLTGGNPAMFELGDLVDELQQRRLDVAVETQGSVWRDWLAHIDRLVISPKPPSSGMDTPRHHAQFETFMARAASAPSSALKVVVFDDVDFAWAEKTAERYPRLPLFLSAGTDIGLSKDETLDALLGRFRWLCEAAARSPMLARARVLPQLHVLAWGPVRGV